MLELIYTGGPIVMIPLTIVLIVLVLQVSYLSFNTKSMNKLSGAGTLKPLYVRYTGFMALSTGMLGQIMGLYGAFIHIEELGTIEPNILYEGFKVSSIPMCYGLIIFSMAMLFYRFFKKKQSRSVK